MKIHIAHFKLLLFLILLAGCTPYAITAHPDASKIYLKNSSGEQLILQRPTPYETAGLSLALDSFQFSVEWADGLRSEWQPFSKQMHFEKPGYEEPPRASYVPHDARFEATNTGGSVPPPTIHPTFRSSGNENRDAVAIIIGNRDYSKLNLGIPDVTYAHNDADLIKRYAVEGLGYRAGNIIDLRDATQANLVSVFGNAQNYKGQLFSWIKPNKSDVFIYYSGHGVPGLKTGREYLVPVDANPNKIELTGYALDTLFTNLAKMQARSITIVIDACFSGSSQAGTLVSNASSITLKHVASRNIPKNTSLLTAARLGEIASWDEEAHMGLFTLHFLEGVAGKADEHEFGNGDGTITLGELKKYLDSEVPYSVRRRYMREQNPQITGDATATLLRYQ